jgi:hypothetical protein
MWRTVYLSKLPGLDKKVRVAFDWTLDLLFAKDVCAVHAIDESRDFHRPDHTANTVENIYQPIHHDCAEESRYITLPTNAG